MSASYLIVGAGFSGAVLARELVSLSSCRAVVIDQREHIAGNAHTERDGETGVMVHKYGPHIFNTSNLVVWNYVQRFGEFHGFVNRVKAATSRGVFSLPINLHTINQFFGTRLGPLEAQEFIAARADHTIGEPANFEEQALKFVGRELYEAFFYGYTRKQWGCEPRELPASILKRLPVRFNYDDNYYTTRYQGIPLAGYTEMVRGILTHDQIEVKLGTAWDRGAIDEFDHVFFTGPIDQFFNCVHGPLGYRSVYWNRAVHSGDHQGNAVINYTDLAEPYTRIHEHKHFAPWEKHERTTVFTEFSKETGPGEDPYYPKRLASDMLRFAKYRELAGQEEKVSFLGRLATYRYMDMHHVIGEALEFAEKFLSWAVGRTIEKPVFAGETAGLPA